MAYAQDVYDVEHKAFILKEEYRQRLPRAMERFFVYLESNTQKTIAITEGGRTHILLQRDIQLLERRTHSTYLYTAQGVCSTPERMEDVLGRLDGFAFCQCHKSFAVNWRYVADFWPAGNYDEQRADHRRKPQPQQPDEGIVPAISGVAAMRRAGKD